MRKGDMSRWVSSRGRRLDSATLECPGVRSVTQGGTFLLVALPESLSEMDLKAGRKLGQGLLYNSSSSS